MTVPTNFTGEVQLAGWSDSHQGGAKVTFWLPSAADLEPFRALTVRKGNIAGHVFMMALVEVGEDGQPVPPPTPAAVREQKLAVAAERVREILLPEPAAPIKPIVPTPPPEPVPGPLCLTVRERCKQANFRSFLAEQFGMVTSADEMEARLVVVEVCGLPENDMGLLGMDEPGAANEWRQLMMTFEQWTAEAVARGDA